MNKQIARLGTVLLVCYSLLFLQLNRVMIFGAEELKSNPNNSRPALRDFEAPRGTISTADGIVIARSVAVDDPDAAYDRQRVYPEGELFGQITGYFTLNLGKSGLESAYNDELAGKTLDFTFKQLDDLFVDRERVGDLTLTVRADVQNAAKDALGLRKGSIVALDPRTGAVLAMWSWPNFDPNPIASLDFDAARVAKDALDEADGNPLRGKAWQDRFSPGSTFKVVTATAGVEAGEVSATAPVYPVSTQYIAPQTSRPLTNFAGSACGGDLYEILRVSCNTAFAQMAIDLGPDVMVDAAEDFGFNDVPPFDLPGGVESVFPTDYDQRLAILAQTAIGQNDVSSTPLQMALVAAAVANRGQVLTPYIVERVTDDEGAVVERHDPTQWRRAMTAESADVIFGGMVHTAENNGTLQRNLSIDGFRVGGKTGTAQLGNSGTSHAWLIGFAGPPAEPPTVAVAVIVEATPNDFDQTGGGAAAPIARTVMATVLTAQGAGG